MNAIRQRNKLEFQLKNLKDFMPLCPNSNILKLTNEIIKINYRLEKIQEFTSEQLFEKIHYQYEIKQSRLNFFKKIN